MASSGPRRRDGAIVLVVALVARFAVVAWAVPRFPPAADGVYYARIAERISKGLGYTWAWPDGAVTYAAHYPVGYPGAVGALYSLFGASAGVGMALNALVGALGALSVHALAARAANRRAALLAGLLVALHPALVAYTPALMTEGVTAALVACAAALVALAREATTARRAGLGIVAVGLVLGVATLVRPQSLLLAPLLGALVALGRGADRRPEPPEPRHLASARRRRELWGVVGAAVATSVIALAVCAPWTVRNCARMGRCALVSVNGGWNLLIGADQASTGAWSPIQVPAACREVWDEAAKDECFGREARRFIAERPLSWAALVPRKLAATFDYCGAAGWYLHESNPEAVGAGAKLAFGAVETVVIRATLLVALIAFARRASAKRPPSTRDRLRAVVAGLGALALFTVHAWLSYAALVLAAFLRGRALVSAPTLEGSAIAVITATMVTHAVFFGAGRYSLVTLPLLCGLVALAARERA